MSNKQVRRLLLCLLLALTLSAAGCSRGGSTSDTKPGQAPAGAKQESVELGGQEVPPDATSVTAALAEGETAKLDSLDALESADLRGSTDAGEIAAWASQHPEVVVRYDVRLPDGRVIDSDSESVDLRLCSSMELEAALDALKALPTLKRVELGEEREGLSWESIEALRAALPETRICFAFDLYGTACDLQNTAISLYHVPIDADDGVFLERVMALMPQLVSVDLDGCGLPMWRCEDINLRFPDVKVVFRVWFGDNYSVRSDVERILASKPTTGGELSPDKVEGLYYCHDVKYLDVGHNLMMTDIGFVAEMPKLEVAILAMCNWSDATPLAKCTNLEYLEMQTSLCTDLSPLSGLKKLRHLNICNIGQDQLRGPQVHLTDITPLYSLTELERLWVGALNDVPKEQIEEMRRRAPNCEVNDTVADPHGGRWRCIDMADFINTYVDTYHERYILLREQFGDYEYKAYSFSWNDPMYY